MIPTPGPRHVLLPVVAILGTLLMPAEAAESKVSERLVHLRGRLGSFAIEEPRATHDGLRVVRSDRGLDRDEIVPWDTIAAVDPRGSDGTFEVGIERGLALGDRLWRGRTRLRRGDARLAREAFLEALQLNRGRSGPMFAIALEGLVAASIMDRRVDEVQAEAVLLGELALAGGRSDRFLGPAYSGDVLDPETMLVPMVPPVMGDSAGLDIRERLRSHPELHESASLRRDLWIRLLDGAGPPDLDGRGLDAGIRFLLQLATLDSEERPARESARRRLLEQVEDAPNWKIAWSRHRAGRSSLMHAEDDQDRLRGVLDLVQVMALEDAAPPSLRLDAGRLLVDGLRTIGRDDEADTIDTMLLIEFPDQYPTENAP